MAANTEARVARHTMDARVAHADRRAKIELHEHGGEILDDDPEKTSASYAWQLDDGECEDTPCYFRVNSTRHSDRVITSGYFTVAGDDVETTAGESVDCGTDAELEDKTFKLLARGSLENFDAATIIKKCSSMGRTLTIVRSQQHERVFGAYANIQKANE